MNHLISLLALLLALPAAAAPDLVVFVRHAEKAADGGSDAPLSEAGRRRAEQLAEALAGSGIQQILTTQWRRTRETAAPLAARLGLQPQVIETRRGADHAGEVAAAVRAASGAVLVVGHSNTVPEIAARLGAPALPMICETSFGHLFVLQPGQPARWLQLRYGAADPQAGSDCL